MGEVVEGCGVVTGVVGVEGAEFVLFDVVGRGDIESRGGLIEEQRGIRHVLITHTHMDHTATLPFLIENIFGDSDDAVAIIDMGSTQGTLVNGAP